MPDGHDVLFYHHDGEEIGAIARYAADGLSAGDRVIVIATEWHAAVLEDLLELRGIDLSEERLQGRYLTLDAARTLCQFMVDGSPDRTLFMRHVGGVVCAAGRDGAAVRAFGEMVALLWGDGNVAAALELEALWNELAQIYAFDLLCAYPTQALDSANLIDIRSVCRQHSQVRAPLRYTATTDLSTSLDHGRQSEVFLPVSESVTAARNFVAGVVRCWGEDELFWDAALITSELATNAAVGAKSPFRVVIDHQGGSVRIAVEDVAPGHPRPRTSAPEDTNGRGLALVKDLAQRWGYDQVDEVKVVWAELSTTPS